MDVKIVEADLSRSDHGDALVELLDDFVRDPAVAGHPLDPQVRRDVVAGMRAHPGVRAWLAWDGDVPIGFGVCILTFSTFAAKPALNVHDLGVRSRARGKGVGRALLLAIERAAREAGCCKLTLEVREDNARARSVYADFGFGHFEPGVEAVPTFFLEKRLGREGA
jgi:ribosomal protein S18 acetylase RimI-like enzyme